MIPAASVTIVGAGLAGMVLAKVLAEHDITTTVLEGEASPDARLQGGLLDVHDDGGQLALRAAGLHEQFLDLVVRGGDAYRFLDRDGSVVHEELGSRPDQDAPDRGSRPEVERTRLRALLIESLPAHTIRWGARVESCVALGDGRSELLLTDGNRIQTDLLVGADGAWSKVRSLLTDVRPEYTGSLWVECNLHDVDRNHTAAARAVGTGSLFALADNRALLGHREPGDRLNVYAAFPVQEGWWTGVNFADSESGKQAVLAEFADWSTDLRALIREADGALIPRPIYRLPIAHRWQHIPGVTLVGDAAHLMPPVGEGANLALLDGGLLGEAIASNPEQPDAAVLAFEEAMFTRSARAASISDRRMTGVFADDALNATLAVFAGLDHPDHQRNPE